MRIFDLLINIARHTQHYDVEPSLQELAKGSGSTVTQVHKLCRRLERLGYVEIEPKYVQLTVKGWHGVPEARNDTICDKTPEMKVEVALENLDFPCLLEVFVGRLREVVPWAPIPGVALTRSILRQHGLRMNLAQGIISRIPEQRRF